MKTLHLLWFFPALCLKSLALAPSPVALRVDGSSEPLGIDSPQPSMAWHMAATDGMQDQTQSAYQVLVASAPELLEPGKADLWDSGRVSSPDSTSVRYAGKPLATSQKAYWSLRIWDGKNEASSWSAPASWTAGVLSAADWKAKWIGAGAPLSGVSPTLLLRKEFAVKSSLKRAVIHISGLGQYNLYLNGSNATGDILSPGWTTAAKTCLYDTYDVSQLLKSGANAIGIELAGGMYRVTGDRYTKFKGDSGPLQAIAMLRLEYADGSSETIPTDASWQSRSGPATFSCIYGGLDFDARLHQEGWSRAGFQKTDWSAAGVQPGPGGTLRGHSASAPPVRVIETLPCASSKQLLPDTIVYDFGQNAPILPKISFHGSPGSVVRLSPSELLGKDGNIDRGSCSHGGVGAYWQYTFGERSDVDWLPDLWYHGARYLQAKLIPGPDGKLPEIKKIEAVVVHSSAKPAGTFECSNDLFNRIHRLIRWSQRANLVSVLTDCPHRERLGWLEQYHLHGPSLRYEWNLDRLWTKTLRDMADAQTGDGLVPDIAPEFVKFKGGFRDSPEWGSSYVIVPWQQYEWTGDTSALAEHFEGMKRYVDYLGKKSQGYIVSHGLGDWYDIGPKPPGNSQLTPAALTATAYYQQTAEIVAKTAKLLGKTAVAEIYLNRSREIKTAFNAKFFDAAKGSYSTGSQTANALPLVFGIVPEDRRADVLAALVKDVETRNFSVTAGDIGHRYLLRALADGGRSDVIFKLHSQTDRPGYGYILNQGATALTEAWDAGRRSSQNHFMLGHIIEWFYHDLGGIQPDPTSPGFRKIIIRPQPVGDITWAKASYQCPFGPIRSQWKTTGKTFHLEIEIPPNTTATVYLPDGKSTSCGSGKRSFSCPL